MNTLGKILVVLNLLFALLTGGFIVFSWATRFRYEQALENQRQEVIAAKGIVGGGSDALASLDTAFKNAVRERDKVKVDLDDAKKLWEIEKKKFEADLVLLKNEATEAGTKLAEKEEEIKRRNDEVKALGEALKSREAAIIELEGKVRFFQAEAIAQKAKADSLQARNDNLLAENVKLYRALAATKTGAPGGIKLPHEPNPPAALVKGTIEKVDADYVHLSVGSDHGLELNHTVEAYRMDPEPTYLGMIRIVEVHHRHSIGRLERTSISRRVPLRAGDSVISEIKFR